MTKQEFLNLLKGYNVIAREVDNKIYIMVEHTPGEFVFPIIDQLQAKQLIKDLNLEILN
jgi:hypothetical protein